MAEQDIRASLAAARAQLDEHLRQGIILFWAARSVDTVCGGFLTSFDAEGEPVAADTDKYLVIQARMIWSFALFHRLMPENPAFIAAARQGVDFLLAHFWDLAHGGWYWQTRRDGSPVEKSKIVYGQSFAVYALAEYTLATGDARGLDYACRTFDLLLKHCADLRRGGYYENMTQDWEPVGGAFFYGDRKSLNTHMHLMEVFTPLYQASRLPVHARRLQECIDLILTHMLYPETGTGMDWFDMDFRPLPSEQIESNWHDDPAQAAPVKLAAPTYLTSYGHNVELAWLLGRAGEVLGQPRSTYLAEARRLVDHSLQYGLDTRYGGLYYVGPHQGPALIRHKGWWQNAEALVGYLDLYALTGDDRYREAFQRVWDFARQHLIHHRLGEWRDCVDETGRPLRGALGHSWKAAYHTARAMVEALQRLDLILGVQG